MAQWPPDQHFYNAHQHLYHHQLQQPLAPPAAHTNVQLQFPPQFGNPFDAAFDYSYFRPYIHSQLPKPDEPNTEGLVMRRPRRTRTIFSSEQIAGLEQCFLQTKYLTPPSADEIATRLGMSPAQVKIWFKNRRRRHKLQLERQKTQISAFSYDLVPLSSSSPPIKDKTSSGPSKEQTMSLSSGECTPTTLTPSPTPTTLTANIVEQYGESINHYNQTLPQSQPIQALQNDHHSNGIVQPYPAAATPHFFASNAAEIQHEHQRQYQLQQQLPNSYYDQRHCSFPQKKQNNNGRTNLNTDIDHNFNNSSYLPMLAHVAALAPTTAVNPTQATSTNSFEEQPLRPNNENNPNVYNGGNASVSDKGDESTKNPRHTPVPDRSDYTRGIDNYDANGSLAKILKDCTEITNKYNSMPTPRSPPPYQSTLDSIIQSHNSRCNAAGNTPFAYCLN